jgi:hypothetical protein
MGRENQMPRPMSFHTQAASAQWPNHLGRATTGGPSVSCHFVIPHYRIKAQVPTASRHLALIQLPTLPLKVYSLCLGGLLSFKCPTHILRFTFAFLINLYYLLKEEHFRGFN